MTTTQTGTTPAAPWGAFEPNGPRKVAWGAATGAGSAQPAPRVGAPASPAEAAAAQVAASADDLGGLFGGDEQPVPSTDLGGLFGSPQPATADLGGLFGQEPAAPPAQADGDLCGPPATGTVSGAPVADLGDIFGAAPEAPSAVPDPSAAAGDATQEPSAPPPESLCHLFDGPADAPAPGFADLFATTTPAPPQLAAPEPGPFPAPAPAPLADTGPAAPVPSFAAAIAAATAGPVSPFQPKPDTQGPAPDAAPSSRIAAQRAHVDAARATTPPRPVAASAESMNLAQDDRFQRAEEFAPLVGRLLGLASSSGDPELRTLINRLELTRDHQRDSEQRAAYQSLVEPLMATNGMQMHTAEDLRILFDIAYDEMLGIGPLGPLWRDDTISEIMVSGPHKVTVERRGQLELTPVRFRDLQHLEETARRMGQSSSDDRAISATNPLVTIQLPGARVQFVWRPLAVSRVAITIRKFGALMGMDQLLGFGSLTDDMAQFLSDAVKARATVLVSGGTGSGKTTFINALSEFIPDTERVITIEDALELQLRNTHVEAFVTKEAASADDRVLFGQDQLLKASLRMRPDRIIVGEIRDASGCAVMLEAANTGHAGTMTTIHANSPALALKRMAGLLRRVDAMPDDVARQEVGSAIDLVVQVVRTRGRRFVSAISVVGDDGTTSPIFTGEYRAGATAPSFSHVGDFGADTALALKMLDAGLDHGAWRR